MTERTAVGPIGTLLADRFRIDRLIGNGGMATVYQATDRALGRTVAVKVFRADSADTAGPERQSGEIAVLASLNHFALVTLFDAGTAMFNDAPRTFIVMELVDGLDLRSRIAQGPLRPAEVAEMGADLAEALHYVHSKGIIHRDIKPANVLLAPSEFPGRAAHAKLADFGIARLFDDTHLTATGTLLGTASYLSPEQALGTALGPPSDVYSLGLVLLECLTGQRAYPGTAVESAMARLHRQPEIPDALGPEWGELLTAMTVREPGVRLSALDAAVRLRGLVTRDTAGDAATMRLPPLSATATMRLPASAPTATMLLPPLAPEDAMTALLTAPGAPDEDTTESRPRRTARPGDGRPHRAGRILLSVVAAAAALAAIGALVFALHPATPAAVPPPSYPAVGGALGTHLDQLQESVKP